MKNSFQTLKSRLSADRLFFRYFLQIFLAMAIIFALFTIYIHRNSSEIFEAEFTSDTQQDVQNLANTMDDLILETEYMISTLINNDTLRYFYVSPSPETVWHNYSGQMQTLLSALQNSKKEIEAVYLYSEASHTVYSSSSHTHIDSFDDSYWLDELSHTESDFRVFPYAMRDKFPYVICVAKEFIIDQSRCAIAIMIDPSNLSILTSINESNDNDAFLISDNSEIIYRYRQENLLEPLDTVGYLSSYQPDTLEEVSIITDDMGTYVLAQQHSSEHSWSYVVVTHLQNYSSRLSSRNAVLFAFSGAFIVFAILFAVFFTIRSLKPIQNIRVFLDSPEMLSINQISDSEDIKYIAGRINQYIQTNHALKDELQKRLVSLNETQIHALQLQINPHFLSNTLNLMYIMATEALGYEHSLPLMIVNTSSLIRYAIEPSKMVSFETELSQTDIYLTILEQRYDRNLKIIHDIAPDTLDAQVPRLFIQPIIENAVFHGFSHHHDSECTLTIHSHRQQNSDNVADSFVIVQVRDNGKGIEKDKLEELNQSLYQEKSSTTKGIGVRNVIQRMNLIYSDKFSFDIVSNSGEGTCFTLTFPYSQATNSPASTVESTDL